MRRPSWSTVPYEVTAVVGLVLLAVVIVAAQLPAARAGDELVTAVEPIVNEAGLARLRADLDEVTAVAAAIDEPGMARLARIAGQSRGELQADIRRSAPEFDAALARMPEIGEMAEAVVGNLERRRGQFETAADLPGGGLTLRDAAWAQLVLALALIAIGVVGVRRPRRSLKLAVLALGAAMVLVPLAFDYPGKARDTDELLDSLRPFSVEKVSAREDALATVRRVFDGYRDDVIPHVAEAAGTTPHAVVAEVEDASPRLSTASLQRTAVILDRFGGMVEFSARIQPLLVRSDELSARDRTRLLIGAGIVLALAGGLGLGMQRKAGILDS